MENRDFRLNYNDMIQYINLNFTQNQTENSTETKKSIFHCFPPEIFITIPFIPRPVLMADIIFVHSLRCPFYDLQKRILRGKGGKIADSNLETFNFLPAVDPVWQRTDNAHHIVIRRDFKMTNFAHHVHLHEK